ncbi:MAG: hypothetical protein ACYDAL_12625 [Candidatus Dormibacteraceae bacterium]
MSAITSDQPSTTVPAVVTTEGGSVTLLDLAMMRERLATLQQEALDKSNQSKSLQALAQDRWRQLGGLLVTSGPRWTPEAGLEDLVQRARALKEQIDSDDCALQEIRTQERQGVAGVFGRVSDWNKMRGINTQRAALEAQLTPILIQIGRQAAQTPMSDAETIRAQAAAAEAEAVQFNSDAASATISAGSMGAEVQQRAESERELGFDAPYVAAYLQTHGPSPIQSPLILKKGEEAGLAVPATLARNQTRQQWVGGSQGVSFPIGHTGIRYRVGSFHGHPIQQQSLSKLDTGTLVATNQRIAFIGHAKSTSIALAKLLHVDCYSDAIAVFQEGHENPDFYLTAQPKYALFMINWFLNRGPTTSAS